MMLKHLISIAFMAIAAGCPSPSFAHKASSSNRCGVCLITNGKMFGENKNKAFAMHSVMKFPQALYVADWLEKNSVSLTDSVMVNKDELMQDTWSPMLKMFDDRKYFTYADLLRLSLTQSDNNACDLLFKLTGSPDKVEKYIRELGFADINIKQTERQMADKPAFAKDNNCTPMEMARLLTWFYQHIDTSEYLAFVWNTMNSCDTGKERLPAAFPQALSIVHKTGTGYPKPDKTADRNDVGIIIMPDGSCMAVAVFVPHSKMERDVANAARKVINKIKKQ